MYQLVYVGSTLKKLEPSGSDMRFFQKVVKGGRKCFKEKNSYKTKKS